MTSRAPRVEVHPAASWASAVAAELCARVRARPELRVCLPTGETPAPLFAALVAAEARGEVSFASATLVILDEWVGLPPGDPARGDVRLRDELLGQLRMPPAAFVAIDVDGPDLEASAARFDAEAGDLDLVLLGLGANGHVGFNEPGTRPEDGTRLVRLARSSRERARGYGATSAPTAGITLGLSRILESGECWLLVTGEPKAAMLRRALAEPEGPDCPASYLRRHPRLVVFADDEAAALLPARSGDSMRAGGPRPTI